MTDEKICDEVLGQSPGYVMGLSYGPKPAPRNFVGSETNLEVVSLKRKSKPNKSKLRNNGL
ncbi:hypothetical protein Sjap_024089 [Stephania japonica]|uniref:Uncharacterized protein n=1 Tax=Stephania japonica TaxID=461633 RepID=A0AAP0HND6_9MAGN